MKILTKKQQKYDLKSIYTFSSSIKLSEIIKIKSLFN